MPVTIIGAEDEGKTNFITVAHVGILNYAEPNYIMKTSFEDTLKIYLDHKVSMRIAANMLGIGRVAEAVKIRGVYP